MTARELRTGKSVVADWSGRLAVIAVVLLGWQLVTATVESFFFPTITNIASVFWSEWVMKAAESWTENIWPSLARLLSGWLLAAVIAIAAGLAIGRSRTIGDYVEPVMHFLRAIPPPALLPLFLVLLGIGDSMKVSLIAFGVIWPILLNVIDGVRAIDPLYLDTADIYQIRWHRRITHIILPAAAPKIFAGLRISLSLAIVLMVISEMIAATNGIGFRILQAQRQFKIVEMWAGLVVLSGLGFMLNSGLEMIERRVLKWQTQ